MVDHLTYHESVAADGAWDAVLKPPTDTTLAQVRATLIGACTPGTPITAAIQEIDGEVLRIALLRDPSRLHGTPSTETCTALAARLTAEHGWLPRPGIRFSPYIFVPLGLREGYALDAPIHTPADVRRHLDRNGATDYGLAAAHLFSARCSAGGSDFARLYDEPGVVITAHPDHLPAITATAGVLRQDRFVVTDYDTKRTYVLRAENQENNHG